MGKIGVVTPNPNIDHLFVIFDAVPPSKQDWFDHLGQAIIILEDGKSDLLTNIYQRKPDGNKVKEFKEFVQSKLEDYKNNMINKPSKVEMVISISMEEGSLFEQDVDNMAKTILDTFKGFVFEDDSQVTKLCIEKHVHPMNKPGIIVAITEITEKRSGAIGNIGLFETHIEEQ